MSLSRGFTLVEMVVVIAIVMMVLATVMPSISMVQQKADLYNTANVIRAVHNVQRSYAMQFGYAGAVYGYTIYKDRTGIRPWVKVGGSVTSMAHADIGRQMFWAGSNPDFITFADNVQPVPATALRGEKPGEATADFPADFHVGFVPRAGFAVVATSGPEPTAAVGGELAGAVLLRSTRSGHRDAYRVDIQRTGVINIYVP